MQKLRVLLCCFVALLFAAIVPGSVAQDQPTGIEWQTGPTTGQLGSMAQIEIPKGYRFTGADGAKRFMELTQNPLSGRELGVLIPDNAEDDKFWFVVFDFDEIGYVKDDEKDKIDADAILKSIQKGTERANETRRSKGWEPFHVVGWARQPYYDTRTNNLSWAIRGKGDGSAAETINFSTRILGRRGSMNVDLVLDSAQFSTVEPEFASLMSGFSYTSGNRYAEFTRGDKVAEYGLTALIAGGAGAVAVKTGFLAKFWKLLLVLFASIAAAIKKMFRKITGLFRNEEPAINVESQEAATVEPERESVTKE